VSPIGARIAQRLGRWCSKPPLKNRRRGARRATASAAQLVSTSMRSTAPRGTRRARFDIDLEDASVHGLVDDEGCVSPFERRAATKVCVFQWPNGASDRRRWPFKQRPRSRVIFVVVPVCVPAPAPMASAAHDKADSARCPTSVYRSRAFASHRFSRNPFRLLMERA
jgi:hypothetical protein